MQCPNCYTQNKDTAGFCYQCGISLAQPTPQPAQCQQCGAELPPNNAFCIECGTPVAGASPVQQAYPPQTPQINLPSMQAPKISFNWPQLSWRKAAVWGGAIVLPLILLLVGVYFLLYTLGVVNPNAYDGRTDGDWVLAYTKSESYALYAINVMTGKKYKIDESELVVDKILNECPINVILSNNNRRFFRVIGTGVSSFFSVNLYREENVNIRAGIIGYILPGEKHLVYAVMRSKNNWEINLSTLDGQDRKMIAKGLAVPRLIIAPEGNALMVHSISGIDDDSSNARGVLNIYSTKTGEKLMNNPINTSPKTSVVGGTLSPNGKYVLYHVINQSAEGLYVADIKGQHTIAIKEGTTSASLLISSSSFTPDSSYIIYQTSSFENKMEIWKSDINGQNQEKLYTTDGDVLWGISPAGKYVIVAVGGYQIALVDITNGTVKLLLSGKGLLSRVRILFGADDKSLVYAYTQKQQNFLYYYDLETDEKKNVVYKADGLFVRSQGGDNKMVYTQASDGEWNGFILDFDSGEAEKITGNRLYEALPDVDIPLVGSAKDELLSLENPEAVFIEAFDGKHLLVSGRTSEYKKDSYLPTELFLYKSGFATELTPLKLPVDFVVDGEFLAKGKRIVFSGFFDGDEDTPNLYVANEKGEDIKLLLENVDLSLWLNNFRRSYRFASF